MGPDERAQIRKTQNKMPYYSPLNLREQIAVDYDKKYLRSENITINWTREELCEFLERRMKKKEGFDSPILPSSPEIFQHS